MCVRFLCLAVTALLASSCEQAQPTRENPMTQAKSSPTTRPMAPLNEQERRVIVDKGTERPFTGKYWNHFERGVYICRQCGSPLYLSVAKFESDCGWPSFDDEIAGAVVRKPDADGRRIEITCASCGGHLGHVFTGERYTTRDTRHCVNSVSIVFVPEDQWPLERAIFAGGCFWGVENEFEHVPGVIGVRSGYIGGTVERPTYRQVCTGNTGHAEAVEIVFDPVKVTYEQLAKLFFEIHDPTTRNRQGPDVGSQYRSAVFTTSERQEGVTQALIGELRSRGYDVVTQVQKAGVFWPAEDYHQDYLQKHPDRPSCHARVKRFE
jgi:peptide methionine sulfoxide reductase msrA/msrB